MKIDKNISIKPYNTFGIDCLASYFCELSSLTDLQELIASDLFKKEKHLILGRGSNVLFTKDFEGIVIHNSIKGIVIDAEEEDYIHLRVNSGELWHDLVMYCVRHQWGGVENLSLIPGTVGAAPIQNIGAYGVEVKDVIEKVEVIDLHNGHTRVLSKEECKFGYRESVFKHEREKNFFISSVTLTLTKKNHRFTTSYGALNSTLNQMNHGVQTLQAISEAVIKIRTEKLPDHQAMGNAGSFFKNPEISESLFQKIKEQYPSIPFYPAANQQVKVPAGWLIEQCGWKGKRIGDAGVHAHQALVLINYGHASGEEIFSLSKKISVSVKEKFSITLTPEVNIF
ncbi:MAG: UDP-N-acetylmuramate dehydrogenase [Bacteroidetes bacterium]|nr:UDP-N-acetylmuramate dehydrogenase [Bacteroidota bacterium]MBS1539805.1 UDP-N-acetylmuramate dehydrogenase [Bacteroidota bacterium]